ncbi:hypothetical protein TNCV_2982711 [Trichonephila clavipes]|nr:hypothetical protein TNCV_2982711 [Trichonephila clavipes]
MIKAVTGSAYLDALHLWLFSQLEESEPNNFIWQQDGAPPRASQYAIAEDESVISDTFISSCASLAAPKKAHPYYLLKIRLMDTFASGYGHDHMAESEGPAQVSSWSPEQDSKLRGSSPIALECEIPKRYSTPPQKWVIITGSRQLNDKNLIVKTPPSVTRERSGKRLTQGLKEWRCKEW